MCVASSTSAFRDAFVCVRALKMTVWVCVCSLLLNFIVWCVVTIEHLWYARPEHKCVAYFRLLVSVSNKCQRVDWINLTAETKIKRLYVPIVSRMRFKNFSIVWRQEHPETARNGLRSQWEHIHASTTARCVEHVATAGRMLHTLSCYVQCASRVCPCARQIYDEFRRETPEWTTLRAHSMCAHMCHTRPRVLRPNRNSQARPNCDAERSVYGRTGARRGFRIWAGADHLRCS